MKRILKFSSLKMYTKKKKIHLLYSTYTQYHRNLLIKLVYTQIHLIHFQTSVIRNERSQWIDSRHINDWTRAIQSSINSWLPVERAKTNGIGRSFDSLKHLDNTLRSCDYEVISTSTTNGSTRFTRSARIGASISRAKRARLRVAAVCYVSLH